MVYYFTGSFNHFFMKKIIPIIVLTFGWSLAFTQTNTWMGSEDTDWHKRCNWSLDVVPTCAHDVVVPNTSNKPIVSGIASCKSIEIQSSAGALVTIQSSIGAMLQIETCPTAITTNTGCIGPISATLTYSPSQANPGVPNPAFGTFTQLLHVIDPGSVTEIQKQCRVVIHNITGGDGGPYTVNFDNVNYGASAVNLGFGNSAVNVDLYWGTNYNGAQGSPNSGAQSFNGSFPSSAVATGVTGAGWAAAGATIKWSGVPTADHLVAHSFSGSVTISDGSGTSFTITLPGGSEGATGAGTTYNDNWTLDISGFIPP